jgi:hypothetical protein
MGDTTRWHNEGNGRHNNGKGQHGDMRHDDGDRRATGGTTTVTGDTARQHDKGDTWRTTTISFFILMRLAED